MEGLRWFTAPASWDSGLLAASKDLGTGIQDNDTFAILTRGVDAAVFRCCGPVAHAAERQVSASEAVVEPEQKLEKTNGPKGRKCETRAAPGLVSTRPFERVIRRSGLDAVHRETVYLPRPLAHWPLS